MALVHHSENTTGSNWTCDCGSSLWRLTGCCPTHTPAVAPPGALAAAAAAGETGTIVMLVEALGADVDAADATTSRTSLHAAAASRHIDAAHALLQVLGV
jgi:hypothetical protein